MSKSKPQTREMEFEFDLPEFEDSDISVILKNNQLTIQAKRSTDKKVERAGFFHDEKTQRDFCYVTSLEGLEFKEFRREFNKGKLKVIVF